MGRAEKTDRRAPQRLQGAIFKGKKEEDLVLMAPRPVEGLEPWGRWSVHSLTLPQRLVQNRADNKKKKKNGSMGVSGKAGWPLSMTALEAGKEFCLLPYFYLNHWQKLIPNWQGILGKINLQKLRPKCTAEHRTE